MLFNKSAPLCALFILFSAIATVVSAQEGYPLDGTWRGEWGQPGGEQTLAVVVMNWDGDTINGRINPGRNMVFFDHASLDPENWIVRFDAISKQGEAIAFEGKLENIGSYNRTLTGTWTLNGEANPVVLTRE